MSSIVWRYSSRSRSRSRFGAARRSFSGGNTQPVASRDFGNGRTRCGASGFFAICAGRATGRGAGSSGVALRIENFPAPAFSFTRNVETDGM